MRLYIAFLLAVVLLLPSATHAQKDSSNGAARLRELFYQLNVDSLPAGLAENLRHDTTGRFMLVERRDLVPAFWSTGDTTPPNQSYRFRLSDRLTAEYKADSAFIDCSFTVVGSSSKKEPGKLILLGVSGVSIVLHFGDSAEAAVAFAAQRVRLDRLFPGDCYESDVFEIPTGIPDDGSTRVVVGKSCSIDLLADDRSTRNYLNADFLYGKRKVSLMLTKRVVLTPE